MLTSKVELFTDGSKKALYLFFSLILQLGHELQGFVLLPNILPFLFDFSMIVLSHKFLNFEKKVYKGML
jgi:hypothetical protein